MIKCIIGRAHNPYQKWVLLIFESEIVFTNEVTEYQMELKKNINIVGDFREIQNKILKKKKKDGTLRSQTHWHQPLSI